MSESILTTTKAALGIEDDYTAFDRELIMHINSVFGTLNQLGIGPDEGFEIEDKTAKWEDFLGADEVRDKRFNGAMDYVYLSVRLVFDPPATSFHTESMKQQITELGWRLNARREEVSWVNPNLP